MLVSFAQLGKLRGVSLGSSGSIGCGNVQCKKWFGRVLCVKTALVDAWKLPARELNGAFETACQSCFETGDIEVGH